MYDGWITDYKVMDDIRKQYIDQLKNKINKKENKNVIFKKNANTLQSN